MPTVIQLEERWKVTERHNKPREGKERERESMGERAREEEKREATIVCSSFVKDGFLEMCHHGCLA